MKLDAGVLAGNTSSNRIGPVLPLVVKKQWGNPSWNLLPLSLLIARRLRHPQAPPSEDQSLSLDNYQGLLSLQIGINFLILPQCHFIPAFHAKGRCR